MNHVSTWSRGCFVSSAACPSTRATRHVTRVPATGGRARGAMSSRSRLLKEIKEAARDADATIRLAPDGENLTMERDAEGPGGDPVRDGDVRCALLAAGVVPARAPRAAFETKIFHPNVHWKTGEICLGHPEGRVVAGVDPALRVPRRAGAAVQPRAGQPSELRRGEHAPRARRHRVLEHGAHVHAARGGGPRRRNRVAADPPRPRDGG